MRLNKKNLLFILCIICLLPLCAQDPSDYKRGAVKSRISLGPVLSFYKNHPMHTADTKALSGFSASYKSEILLGRKINILIGLEYFSQGLSFRGYFSAPGSTYLFDKTFAYTHEIRVQEIHIPIGFKRAFNLEKDNLYTSYYFGGLGARFIIGSYYVINNDSTGNVVFDGKANLNFEHHLLSDIFQRGENSKINRLNTFIFGGLGTQYNLRASAKAVFFELTYKYGISRLHYQGYQNSNDLNIKESHIMFNLGLKF